MPTRSGVHRSRLLARCLLAASAWLAPAVRAESPRQQALRTNEAQTPEPLTKTPLKAAMQNLFLQEDPFPQQHLQLQAGIRVAALDVLREAQLSANAAAELGLVDSWTLSVRAPVGLSPADERGLGNPELGVLYSLWVSRDESLRLTANLRNVFPSPSGAGTRGFAHDLSLIGYARLAPIHLQAVATLDVSYGPDVAHSPRVRPEAAIASILKWKDVAWVLEAAAQREFEDLRYISALGVFWYPASFELGVAALAVWTRPREGVGLGANALVSYAFDPPT
jgi:hypothetical protein